MKKLFIILIALVAVPGLVSAGLYLHRARTLSASIAEARNLLGTRQGHALIQDLAKNYPENADVLFLQARSLGFFGRGADAETALAKAKALGWPRDGVERLYWILVAQRKFRGEAEAELQALRDKDGSDTGVLLALAEGYKDIRRAMAEQLVNKVLTIDPDNGWALCLRGYLYMKDPEHPDIDRASADLEAAMRRGPDTYYYPQTRLLLARCLREKGAFPAALKLYEECRAEQPNDWQPIYGIGLCERYLENYQKSLNAFEDVLRIVPRHVNARLHIAYIHEVLGDLPKSLEVLRSIEAEYSDQPQMLMQTAKILAKIGDKKQAADYQKRYEEMIKRYHDEERMKTRELNEGIELIERQR